MRLVRVARNAEATYGVLVWENTAFAVTLELPWRENKRGESCIPHGKYQCKKVHSPKFGSTYEVTGVPGRSEILFHKGNLSDDTHGCILIGEQFNPVLGRPGITASREGYAEFTQLTLHLEEFTLEIIEAT
jgi:hypothetical protein